MAYKLVVILSFLCVGFSYNARYGGELYQDGKNAQSEALGGLSVSYTDGSNRVLLKNRNIPSIHFSHKNKFGGMARVTALSYLHPGKKYPLYFGLTSRSVYNIPNTISACDHSTLECNYSEIDYFSQQEIGIKLSTIRSLGLYTLGFSLKPSFTSLAEFGRGYGISFDVAAMLQPLDKLDVTLGLEDILGLRYWDTGNTETISPLFMGGIYYRFSKLAIGVETGSRIESHNFLNYHMGIEYEGQDQLFFRVGTSHLNQFTAGIGIQFKHVEFSYAYLYPEKAFEASHIMSAGINLDEIHRIKGKITP